MGNEKVKRRPVLFIHGLASSANHLGLIMINEYKKLGYRSALLVQHFYRMQLTKDRLIILHSYNAANLKYTRRVGRVGIQVC